MKELFFALALGAFCVVAAGQGSAGDRYRSPGKQRAPIELTSAAVYQADVGEVIKVPLEFTLATAVRGLRIEIQATDGLELDRQTRSIRQLDAVAAGPVVPGSVSVTSLAAGRHYLDITVFLQNGDESRFRSFSLPVEVGDITTVRAGKRAGIGADDAGRPIHILPARDTL